MGPWSYARHLVSGPRLPFTAAYFGSIGLTLYFAIGVSPTLPAHSIPLPSIPSPLSITKPRTTPSSRKKAGLHDTRRGKGNLAFLRLIAYDMTASSRLRSKTLSSYSHITLSIQGLRATIILLQKPKGAPPSSWVSPAPRSRVSGSLRVCLAWPRPLHQPTFPSTPHIMLFIDAKDANPQPAPKPLPHPHLLHLPDRRPHLVSR